MDIKKVLVEKLEKDCEIILNEKLSSALNNNNEGSYRNLVKALETNLELIDYYNSQNFKDIIIKNLSDLKILNSNGDIVHKIELVTNIDICHIVDGYGEFKGLCIKNIIPTELLNKNYKIISNGTLESAFNKRNYEFELIIDKVELFRQTRNDELSFRMFADYGNPLYTINIAVK